MKRNVILYTDADQSWIAVCPSLPGCTARGPSKESALANIKRAVQEQVAALKHEGRPITNDGAKIWLDRV